MNMGLRTRRQSLRFQDQPEKYLKHPLPLTFKGCMMALLRRHITIDFNQAFASLTQHLAMHPWTSTHGAVSS